MQAEEIIDTTYARHKRAALMFSGGKDSLAVLELARPHWGNTAVVWVDTGAQLPEIHALMDKFAAELPYLFIVKSNQPAQVLEFGHPVDVLPVWYSQLGQAIGGAKGIKMQSWMDCCKANVWTPSYEFVKSLGVTALLRGQRADERFTAPTRSGEVHDGIELVYPIQDWTHDNVLEYLTGLGHTEERLQLGHSSLDCWDCTAFVGETADRLAYLRAHHPEKAKKVYATLQNIAVVTQHAVDDLTKALGEQHG